MCGIKSTRIRIFGSIIIIIIPVAVIILLIITLTSTMALILLIVLSIPTVVSAHGIKRRKKRLAVVAATSADRAQHTIVAENPLSEFIWK